MFYSWCTSKYGVNLIKQTHKNKLWFSIDVPHNEPMLSHDYYQRLSSINAKYRKDCYKISIFLYKRISRTDQMEWRLRCIGFTATWDRDRVLFLEKTLTESKELVYMIIIFPIDDIFEETLFCRRTDCLSWCCLSKAIIFSAFGLIVLVLDSECRYGVV
jgi:hypothetical protein